MREEMLIQNLRRGARVSDPIHHSCLLRHTERPPPVTGNQWSPLIVEHKSGRVNKGCLVQADGEWSPFHPEDQDFLKRDLKLCSKAAFLEEVPPPPPIKSCVTQQESSASHFTPGIATLQNDTLWSLLLCSNGTVPKCCFRDFSCLHQEEPALPRAILYLLEDLYLALPPGSRAWLALPFILTTSRPQEGSQGKKWLNRPSHSWGLN